MMPSLYTTRSGTSSQCSSVWRSDNSLANWEHLSNIFSKPAIGLNNSMSSAYSIQPKNNDDTQQPVPRYISCSIRMFIKHRLAGDKQLPCLTPLQTVNYADNSPFHLTAYRSLLYQLHKTLTIVLGRYTEIPNRYPIF